MLIRAITWNILGSNHSNHKESSKYSLKWGFSLAIAMCLSTIASAVFASPVQYYIDSKGDDTTGLSLQHAFKSPKTVKWQSIARNMQSVLNISGGTYSDPLVAPNLVSITIKPCNIAGHSGSVTFKAGASSPSGSAAVDVSNCYSAAIIGDSNFTGGSLKPPKVFGITVDGFNVGVKLGGNQNTSFGHVVFPPCNSIAFLNIQNCKLAGIEIGAGQAGVVLKNIALYCNLINNGSSAGGAHVLKTDPQSLCQPVFNNVWIHNTDGVAPSDGVSLAGGTVFMHMHNLVDTYPQIVSCVIGPGLAHGLITDGDVSLSCLYSLFIDGQVSNLTCQNYSKLSIFNVEASTLASLQFDRSGKAANNIELMSALPQGFNLKKCIVAGGTVRVLPGIHNNGNTNVVNASGNTQFVASTITPNPLFNSDLSKVPNNASETVLAGLDFTPKAKAAKGLGSSAGVPPITSVQALLNTW